MEIFLATVAFISIAVAGMAVGVIFGQKSLKGSCGGLGKVMGEDCQICDKKDQCTDEEKSSCDGEHFVPQIKAENGKAVLRLISNTER